MDHAIITHGLTRRFGEHTAVDHLDLVVQPGEVFGFLGPNGAGKTTTVRLLNGVLSASAGTAEVLGLDVATQGEQVRRLTGVLTESPSLYEALTARQTLAFCGEVYGVDRRLLPRRIEALLEEFGLADRADDRVGAYSKGMRQRLAIARTLLHDPPLLFFDEPTSGLDPEAARMVTGLIQQLSRSGGRTVFLCTHNLDEAQRLCDRVGVIGAGRLRAVGSPAELAQALWDGVWVEVDLREPPSPLVRQRLDTLAIVRDWEREGGLLRLHIAAEDDVPDVVAALVDAGARLYAVRPQPHTLEEIYFRIQQGGADGEVEP